MKEAYNNATQHKTDSGVVDPSLRHSFSFQDRLKRGVWSLCWLLLNRPSPRLFHSRPAWLLKKFGAKIGARCHFYSGTKIWAPWSLFCEDRVTAGYGAEIYNPVPMYFGPHAIVSQGTYICGATHDYDDPQFPSPAYSMKIGSYAWVCARAVVGPGVNIADGAVLDLAPVATQDLEASSVYAGTPAQRVKCRRNRRQAIYLSNRVQLVISQPFDKAVEPGCRSRDMGNGEKDPPYSERPRRSRRVLILVFYHGTEDAAISHLAVF